MTKVQPVSPLNTFNSQVYFQFTINGDNILETSQTKTGGGHLKNDLFLFSCTFYLPLKPAQRPYSCL